MDYDHCGTPYGFRSPFFGVCGTDNKNYFDLYHLMCEQTTKYGKRVNLQLKHHWECFTWDKYSDEIKVSKLQVDSISMIEAIQIFVSVSFAASINFPSFCHGSCWCVLVHLSSDMWSQASNMEKR